jgi:YesN/AraC family two-component response regulator
MDGVTAAKVTEERRPQVRVIELTSFKEKEYVEEAAISLRHKCFSPIIEAATKKTEV